MSLEFVASLADKVTAPAQKMTQATDKLAMEMKVLQQSVASTEKALVKANALGDIKKHQQLTQQLASFKAAQQAAAQSVDTTSSSSAGLQAELAEMSGGLSLVVETLGAVALAGAVATGSMMAFAVSATEAKTKSLALWDALGEGKIAGREVDDMLDGLRDKLGVTKEYFEPFAEGFLKMGITGKEQLEGLTVAAASANAMVEGGGAAFTKLQQQINAAAESGAKLTIPYKKLESQLTSMGLNVNDLADQMKMSTKDLVAGLKAGTIDAGKLGDALTDAATNKGAGPLQTLSLSTANLGKLIKEYLVDMVEDLGDSIKPLMKEVKSLFDIFGQSKPSGQALKAGIGAWMKQSFAMLTKIVPMVKHMFLQFIIWGLKAYIAVKPLIAYFKQLWESNKDSALLTTVLDSLWKALKTVGLVVAVVVGLFVALWAAGLAIGAGLLVLIGIIVGFAAQAGDALTGWAMSAVDSAKNFIDGLVNGITSGATAVVNAVKGLAGKAKDTFKSALGIASPSKEMAKLGKFAGDGVAVGLDASQSTVTSSAKDLGSATTGGAAGGMGGGSGGGINVTVEKGAIVIEGAGKGVEELTEQAVSLIFERIALSQGL